MLIVKRALLPLFWSLVGAAIVGLLVYGLSTQGVDRTLDEAVLRREWPRAPEASKKLPSINGRGESSLLAYRGKVVILNFWASWCTPCQNEAPALERVQPQLERHDATVLGVTYNDVTPDSLKFIHEFKLTYPSLRDVTGSFVHSYGTEYLPESFVIDRSGRIRAIERNAVSKRFLQNALELAKRT